MLIALILFFGAATADYQQNYAGKELYICVASSYCG